MAEWSTIEQLQFRTNMSSISYFATRRLLIEGPGEIDSGAWPITWFRIAKGWGMLPEAYWPYESGDEIDPRREPPNLDQIAKGFRLPYYHRARTEQEILYTIFNRHPVTVSLEISREWKNPPQGRIPFDRVMPRTVAIHQVPIYDFNFDLNSFVFSNSWHHTWGDKGTGYLPLGYLSRFLVDAWILEGGAHIQIEKPGIHINTPPGRESRLGIQVCINVLNGEANEVMAWIHATLRPSAADVEELYVRPAFRRSGCATKLVQVLKNNLPKEHPIRYWVPWGDHCEINESQLLGWMKAMGLRLEPSGVRWAAFCAKGGQPVESLPALKWIPSKATSPIHLLDDVDEAVGTAWNEVKATRRAQLVEKKYRSTLTQEELIELDGLQLEFGEYQDLISPLALD